MTTRAWTEEERAAVGDMIDAMLEVRQPKSFEYRAAYLDAVLDLLAGLRERIDVFLRDESILEGGNAALLDFSRQLLNAAADGIRDRVPLLPRDPARGEG